MTKTAFAIALCLVAAPALAAPPKPNCISLEKLERSAGPDLTTLPVTRVQYHFLRGVYAMNPQTPPGLPPGDSALLVRKDGAKSAIVLWIMGPLVCGTMPAPPQLLELLDQVKSGDATGDDL